MLRYRVWGDSEVGKHPRVNVIEVELEMTWSEIILIALLFSSITINFYLVNEISSRFPALYDDLGKPGRFIVNAGQIYFLYSFILLGHYKSHQMDAGLKRLCLILRLITIGFHVALIWGLVGV
jgi:hypothetical protein